MPQSAPVTPIEPICGAYLCSIPFCFRVQNDIPRLEPLASSPPLKLMPIAQLIPLKSIHAYTSRCCSLVRRQLLSVQGVHLFNASLDALIPCPSQEAFDRAQESLECVLS